MQSLNLRKILQNLKMGELIINSISHDASQLRSIVRAILIIHQALKNSLFCEKLLSWEGNEISKF